MKHAVHNLATSPWLNVFAGLTLLVTSAWETWETIESGKVAAHHGVFVYALVQLIRVFPDLLEGVKSLHEGIEED